MSSKGKYIETFEEGFTRYCGCEYGIATTSGTTALHLALASLDLGSGDEVIVPAFTMAATVLEKIDHLVTIRRRNAHYYNSLLMSGLKEKGIETRTFFYPMHQQPVFQEMGLFNGEKYPVAEALAPKGLYLPSGSGLKGEEIETVCQTIKEIRGKIWTF